MEELLEVLNDVCPDVDFENEKGLIDNKVLTSFDVLSIIGELNDAFDIKIGPGDILPTNFNSVDAIWALVSRLKG
ncbi:MAG: acyl carrier protein [Blautia sp.]|nr:acyl carrier protein [Blautia sp.]